MIRKLNVLLLILLALVSVTSLLAQPQSLTTRHVRDAVVAGEAQSLGRLPANQTMRFDIVLALRHPAELDNFLQELYDPTSPSYRHFVTPEEFTARFGPSQEDYDAVVRFAAASGFKLIRGSRDGMDVQLEGTVASVEKAFHVTMGLFQHPTEKRTFFAPDREPSVDLPFQLWHISGLDNYALPRTNLKRSSGDGRAHSNVSGSCPGDSYCGSDMRAAYYGGTLTGTGQNIALLELAGTDLADLNTYYSTVGQTKPYTPTLISAGGYGTSCLASNGCDDTEQTIDMTQAMGMAPGSKMLYMYICGDAFGSGAFSDTACLSAMSTTTDAPLSAQISSSWAWSPADNSTDDPYFKKFAAQGQNFFDAAGDNGSYPTPSSPYYFPAEDAYITAVGGTDLLTTTAGGAWSSETAWPDGGGGISPDSIAIPAWQQLAGVINSSNHGSTTLRNIPDVAAEANFDFYYCSDQQGCGTGLGGTSFAAPMWAGYMALVNQQAIANGNPPVGFVNPSLYNIGIGSSYATDFHDITSGSNGGFSAVKGYDLVTGWGSPNGSGLINALAGPAGPNFSLSANPASLSIQEGNSGTSTITVTPAGGFTGSVTLTASGLPSGVTAAFGTNPTTSTSILTLTASATAATGTATVTITGTSGSLTSTTTVSLTVTAAPVPGFTLSANPSSVSIQQGASGASTITVTPVNGFSGNVTLVASGLPSGVTATFVPNPTATTSTLTLTASPSAATGTATVTITGTSGALTATTTLRLTVTVPTVPVVTLTPASLTFPTRKVGTTSPAKVITLKNTGNATLNIASIGISGDFAFGAATTKPCGATLAAGKSCTLKVTFTPTQTGTRTGDVTFTDNAANSPQQVPLTGTGK